LLALLLVLRSVKLRDFFIQNRETGKPDFVAGFALPPVKRGRGKG
jgi:hypothetical protein